MLESETVKIVESDPLKKIRAPAKSVHMSRKREQIPWTWTKAISKPYLSKTVRKFEHWGPEICESEGQLLSHLQTYVYIHIYILYIYICMYIHICMYIYIYIYMFIYIYIILNTYVYLSTKLYKYMHVVRFQDGRQYHSFFLSAWQFKFVSLFSLFFKKGVYIRPCKFREKTSELRTGSRTSSFLRCWETYCARRSVLPSFEEDLCNTILNTTF